MTASASPEPAAADLTACDREPIHTPGHIQPHGVLLVLDAPGGTVVQASANAAALLGRPPGTVLGRTPADLFGAEAGAVLREGLANPSLERNPLVLPAVSAADRSFHAVAHGIDGVLVLELEPAPGPGAALFQGLSPLVRTFLGRLERVDAAEELCGLAAAEARRLTGFNRALVYRFDKDGNGTVVGEDRDDVLPSYLGLRFPASDIPRQARELYRLNRLRLITDTDYVPVPLEPARNPVTGRPLDLSYAALRSVSPVHVAYMKNMGTGASMSVSLLREGRLWGLISCHHRTARGVPFEVRAACDFLGQVLSLQLAAKEHKAAAERRAHLKGLQTELLAAMAGADDFLDGLAREPEKLLGLTGAAGAAVLFGERGMLLGVTPPESEVKCLREWLVAQPWEAGFSCENLPAHFPRAEAYKDRACGLLAISLSKQHRGYVLWFRPEAIQTIRWAGDPRKPVEAAPDGGRLHPRTSFETWKETVRGRSFPWAANETRAASELQNAVVQVVLGKAEELAGVYAELERSNKELEAFSYSVSHDLRAPFRHILGYAELLEGLEAARMSDTGRRYLANILESAHFAGTLVDNLLHLCQVGRTALTLVDVDMNQLVQEVRQELSGEAKGRPVTWRVAPLPPARGDVMMLRLVLRNLLANAVKYSRTRPEAVIEVGARPGAGETVYFVKDNGVGFDMRYAHKLFGAFQRLHRPEEFEGTGIGLANVKRIVERHGGRAWAEGQLGEGATFSFALPKPH